jgi:hypothetical protein
VSAAGTVMSNQGNIALSTKSIQPPVVSDQYRMTDSGPVISILKHAWSEMTSTGLFVTLRARTIASLNRLLTANSFAERHP